MATIGLSDVYYAPLTTDSASDLAYGTPVRIPGAIQADINPNTSSSTLFADDGPWETASALGEITLTLNMADIPLPTLAVLLGATYEGGVFKNSSTDTPPFVALGFRALKANGNYRYFWLFKGKFAPSDETLTTKEDTISWDTPTIEGSFVTLINNGLWRAVGDADETDFTMANTWFTDPVVVAEAAAPSGP